MVAKQKEVLLLCDRQHGGAKAINDHIEGLAANSNYSYKIASMLGEIPPGLELDRFDAIVIHYTLVCNHKTYLSPSARSKLSSYRGLKAVFAQDEHQYVNETIELLREIVAHVLFTCVPSDQIEKVYPRDKLPKVDRVNVLTGYVDASLLGRSVMPWSDRPIDVGYRARELPAWLGELAQEKVNIAKRFSEDAGAYGLNVDIAWREEDRFQGGNWSSFVESCKAVLGVESGASVFDYDGSIKRRVEEATRKNPKLTFAELQECYFKQAEGRIRMNQISPRCFEAAALRTLMILYEGDYSQRLVPGRHYVPLRKDHSNMAEVVQLLRTPERAQAIIDRAYREVACNPKNSYQAMADIVDDSMATKQAEIAWTPVPPYSADEFKRRLAPSGRERILRARRLIFHLLHRLILGKILVHFSDKHRSAIRRFLRGVYGGATNLLRRLH